MLFKFTSQGSSSTISVLCNTLKHVFELAATIRDSTHMSHDPCLRQKHDNSKAQIFKLQNFIRPNKQGGTLVEKLQSKQTGVITGSLVETLEEPVTGFQDQTAKVIKATNRLPSASGQWIPPYRIQQSMARRDVAGI